MFLWVTRYYVGSCCYVHRSKLMHCVLYKRGAQYILSLPSIRTPYCRVLPLLYDQVSTLEWMTILWNYSFLCRLLSLGLFRRHVHLTSVWDSVAVLFCDSPVVVCVESSSVALSDTVQLVVFQFTPQFSEMSAIMCSNCT